MREVLRETSEASEWLARDGVVTVEQPVGPPLTRNRSAGQIYHRQSEGLRVVVGAIQRDVCTIAESGYPQRDPHVVTLKLNASMRELFNRDLDLSIEDLASQRRVRHCSTVDVRLEADELQLVTLD